MKTANLVVLTLAAAVPAFADFSYTSTTKTGGAVPPQSTKHYLKGQKMMMDSASTATILDFEAQTITIVNKSQKTYSVTPFSSLGQGLKSADANMDAKIDVKETGQQKSIGGYSANEVLMTMTMDAPQAGPSGVKMQLEMDMWLAKDVPGAQELKGFYARNAGRFPYAALAGRAGAGMQKGMADMQEKMASLGGVPVLQITRMKGAGGGAPAMPQMSAAQQQQMAQARARFEEMAKQGGPQAKAAQQALASMGAMSGGAGGSGALFETTTESSEFSAGSIASSLFEVPAGFQKTERK